MVSNKVYLTNWIVREVEDNDSIHFVGLNMKTRLFVVSECIISYNSSLKVGTTRNETHYYLSGPAREPLAESSWETWCKNRGVKVWKDITKEYYV